MLACRAQRHGAYRLQPALTAQSLKPACRSGGCQGKLLQRSGSAYESSEQLLNSNAWFLR